MITKLYKIITVVLFVPALLFGNEQATPSNVFSQVMQIEKELLILKKHLNITKGYKFDPIEKTELKPRHAWQKTYEIMVKINVFRRAHSLPTIEPVNMEPVLNIAPVLTYEQTQRILAELSILKFRLGITKKVSKADKYKNKTPMNVFNKLREVSSILDVINGSEFSPSYVFGEAMRIYKDINIILNKLKIADTAIPPEKVISDTPKDSLLSELKLLEKIFTLERSIGLEGIDVAVFYLENPGPPEVFELTQIILAELQVIKASLGIRHEITQAAHFYSQKTPADVNQLIGWSLLKMKQISTLR